MAAILVIVLSASVVPLVGHNLGCSVRYTALCSGPRFFTVAMAATDHVR